jgi:hypothetical protein
MPIEIKELNIKIYVSDKQNKAATGSDSGDKEKQNEIVAQCVEQVLEIISKTHER